MSREIDRKVAEALGWTNFVGISTNPDALVGNSGTSLMEFGVRVPHYSTDIAAAIGALEEYCTKHNGTYTITRVRYVPSGAFACYRVNINFYTTGSDQRYVSGVKQDESTIPLAICNAITEAGKK